MATSENKHSFVWNYYSVVQSVANCNKCKTEITLPTSCTTPSMINHLKTSNNDLYKEFMGSSNEVKNNKPEYKKVSKID